MNAQVGQEMESLCEAADEKISLEITVSQCYLLLVGLRELHHGHPKEMADLETKTKVTAIAKAVTTAMNNASPDARKVMRYGLYR